MLIAGNNQSSSFSHLSSPSSPPDLFLSFPLSNSLCMCLSLFPWLCMTLSCAHDSASSLKAWMQSVSRNSSVSHSLGKRGGGCLCSLMRDGMPLYAYSTSRSGQGILVKLRTLHPEQVTDAIQPSHPLSPPLLLHPIFPSLGSFPVSQLFTSGEVLEHQHQSFQ